MLECRIKAESSFEKGVNIGSRPREDEKWVWTYSGSINIWELGVEKLNREIRAS